MPIDQGRNRIQFQVGIIIDITFRARGINLIIVKPEPAIDSRRKPFGDFNAQTEGTCFHTDTNACRDAQRGK